MLKNRPPHRDAQGELHGESWRVFQIMAEFVQGFERLPELAPCVSLFGSTADEVLQVIFDHYATRGFEPSPEEARVMREL
jgi:hypothetical protein